MPTENFFPDLGGGVDSWPVILSTSSLYGDLTGTRVVGGALDSRAANLSTLVLLLGLEHAVVESSS